MIKAIIFDMDGVIIDSEETWIKVVGDVFAEYGHEYTEYMQKKVFGSNAARIMKQNFDIKDSEAEISRNIKEKFRQKIISEGVKEIPGIYQLLERLEKKFVLALASSTPRNVIEMIIEKLNIEYYFSVVLSGFEVKDPKPHPDIFLAVTEKIKLKPDECLVVEDSPNGVKAAKSAGMKCIALKSKYASESELKEADVIVKSLDEITIKLLKDLS